MKAIRPADERTSASSVVQKSRNRRKVNPLSPPTTLELRGIRIHFPFRPYKCQEVYMEKVLDALLRSENALLESPTGTGKTCCLLAATLSWQIQQSRLLQQASEFNESSGLMASQDGPNKAARVPTIIYASRTHSQLSQVVRELRNTRYRPHHAVLGSREQMCVNPKVKKQHSTAFDINHDCNKLGKERKCRFRNNLEGFVPPSEQGGADTQPVMDMEDLVSMGRDHKICPFYYTRSQVEKAELVLVPYNYLFDKDARDTTLADIPWDNAVVIFDEAHNLESFASDSASFDLSSTDIAGCIAEVQRAMNYLQAMPDLNYNLKEDNLIRLKAIFLKLEDHILNLGNRTAFSGEFMMEIFQQGAGINHANNEILIEELRKVNDLIMDMRGTGATRSSPRLEHFVQCLKRVYGYALESRCLAKAAFYRVHVSPKQQGNQNSRTISYWCFAPALAMEELANLNVRSILVTSGTLSPLPSYSMELGLSFPHTLENPHIVGDDQIHVRVIGKGVSGKLLTSSYERRKDGEYYAELGNTLVALAKVTPMGMLIFFPSYGVMETCLERWGGPAPSNSGKSGSRDSFFAKRRRQASSNRYSFPMAPTSYYDKQGPSIPWKRLLATKSVVIEPRSSAELPDAIAEFQRFLGMPKSPGAILMGVCRGKISEGIDFPNDMSRAVVITGLPFPPSHDPKVKLKREYLDGAKAAGNLKSSSDGGFGGTNSVSTASNKLSGHDWYSQQAHRAVNQAIGRVIRNKSDYGAVLLLDSRFDQPRNREGLSRWVRPHIQKDEGFGTAIRSLAKFYKDAESGARVRKEAEAKTAAQSPVLEYEDEFTKVAFIRNDSEPGKTDNSGHVVASVAAAAGGSEAGDATAYVAPGQVIARVELNSMQQCQLNAKGGRRDEASAAKSAPKQDNFDAVFNARQKPQTVQRMSASTGSEKPKAVAVEFMEKVRSKLSKSEQSAVRKAIVAMKGFGEKKDIRSYRRSAREIICLVVHCEKFETAIKKGENSMLFLFFQLLPNAYRSEVEVMALELVFEASSLGILCKENLESTVYARERSSIASVLHSVWCAKSGETVSVNCYLQKARQVLSCLVRADKTASSNMLNAYCKLLPARFVAPSRALFDELNAKKNMQIMKQAEKNRTGEDSVDVARFHPASRGAPLVFQNNEVDADSTARSSVVPVASKESQVLKRKRPDEEAKAPVQRFNPYAKKDPPARIVASAERQETTKRSEKSPLASYLETVETGTFIKRSTHDIKSNAPRNLVCPICSTGFKEPLIAECGHMACLKCWVQWLDRSQSCPTCRVSTTKESLARAVFEKRPGSGAPTTLSQLCDGQDDEEESDGELEICT